MWPYICLGLTSNYYMNVFFNLTSLSFSSFPLCHIKLGLGSVNLNGTVSTACGGLWIRPKGRVSRTEWGGCWGFPFPALTKAPPPHLFVFALVLLQFNSYCLHKPCLEPCRWAKHLNRVHGTDSPGGCLFEAELSPEEQLPCPAALLFLLKTQLFCPTSLQGTGSLRAAWPAMCSLLP